MNTDVHTVTAASIFLYPATEIETTNHSLTLHNKKVRIINIQLHRMKQIRHLSRRTVSPIDQILVLPPYQHLTRHVHLLALLVSHGTAVFILVVKDYGNRGLVYSGLALFVDQFGEVAGTDLGEVLNA